MVIRDVVISSTIVTALASGITLLYDVELPYAISPSRCTRQVAYGDRKADKVDASVEYVFPLILALWRLQHRTRLSLGSCVAPSS
jgi:hypothetical protein